MSDMAQISRRSPLPVRALRKIAQAVRRAVWAAAGAAVRRIVRVRPGKIAFMTNSFSYSCNPKYIYEELKRRDPGRDMVWIVSAQGPHGHPPDARTARLGTLRALAEAYSAGMWIDNGVAFSQYFTRRSGQRHIQTMHGSLGIKKIDNAVLSRNKRGWSARRVVRRETELTDFVVTNSAFEEGVFRRVFWKLTPMVRLGHARTDPLFGSGGRGAGAVRADLERMFGVPRTRRLAMFAPTHRRDLEASDLDFGFARMVSALETRFGGEWTLLVRFHVRTKNIAVASSAGASVVDVSRYPDMQELMTVVDVGITDYSSWIFDYVVTGRPGFIFATDLERYSAATGLCYPLEETPFPVAYDAETLFANVASFDEAAYARRVREFLDSMQCVDDGHSASRIADWLATIQG